MNNFPIVSTGCIPKCRIYAAAFLILSTTISHRSLLKATLRFS
ncbi:MAG: hypothetical protein ACJATF_002891, partial [Flavobacteriales bacterium]